MTHLSRALDQCCAAVLMAGLSCDELEKNRPLISLTWYFRPVIGQNDTLRAFDPALEDSYHTSDWLNDRHWRIWPKCSRFRHGLAGQEVLRTDNYSLLINRPTSIVRKLYFEGDGFSLMVERQVPPHLAIGYSLVRIGAALQKQHPEAPEMFPGDINRILDYIARDFEKPEVFKRNARTTDGGALLRQFGEEESMV